MTAHSTDPDLSWFFDTLDTPGARNEIAQRLQDTDPAATGLAAYLVLSDGRAVPESALTRVANALVQELEGTSNSPCPPARTPFSPVSTIRC